MTVDRPMRLPGSDRLRSWWQSLAGYEPRRLWYAHLLLHRVEVLVELRGLSPAEQLLHALLGWIASYLPPSREQLAAALHFPLPYLDRLLSDLHQRGWLHLDPPRLTAAGQQWYQQHPNAGPSLQRRAFLFLEGPGQPFLAVDPQACQPLDPVPENWHWQAAGLETALAQPDSWKTRHGFPLQVVRWLPLPSHPTEMHALYVPLAHAEQAYLALVESGRDHGAILGFRVSLETGHLDPAVVWRLPDAATLEELERPPAEWWRESWLAWCQARQLPVEQAQACQLQLQGHTLHVHAPPPLLQRLRQGRSESLEGTAWILAHRGRIRPAARLHLEEKRETGD